MILGLCTSQFVTDSLDQAVTVGDVALQGVDIFWHMIVSIMIRSQDIINEGESKKEGLEMKNACQGRWKR